MIAISDPLPLERFEKCLARQGMRLTTQRRLVVDRIFSKIIPFEANELVEYFQNQSAFVSRPTIFRTLAALVDCGLLKCTKSVGKVLYDPISD